MQPFVDLDWRVRAAEIQQLGGHATRENLEIVSRLAQDVSEVVRYRAINLLLRLVRQIQNDVRQLCTFLPRLIWLMRSNDAHVRAVTCEIAGLYRIVADYEPRVWRMLLAALDDRDLTVRCRAAEALGNVRATNLIPVLLVLERQAADREFGASLRGALKQLQSV